MRSAILSVLALIFLATSALAETRIVNSPGDGFLNLRTGPGSGFAVLGEMDHGSYVTVLERAGGWWRVEHESGVVGWAFAKYLAPADTAPGYLIVKDPTDGWLNLRTGPGTSYAIVTRMDNGTWVEVLERSGNWLRVRHEFGAVGWAHSAYLKPPK